MRFHAVAAVLLFLLGTALPGVARPAELDSMNTRAEDFSFVDAAGKTHALKEYLGKPIILHFWATWCTSCAKEIPELARLAEEWSKQGVELLAISVDESSKKAEVSKILAGLRPSIPLRMVVPDKNTERYWAWGLPTTYFVDAKGIIFARALGARDWQDSHIRELFQKRKVTEKSKR